MNNEFLSNLNLNPPVEVSPTPTSDFSFDISTLSGVEESGYIKPSDKQTFWKQHLNEII